MYITIIIALLIAAAFVVAKRTSNDDILTVAVVIGIVLAVILPISVATLIVSYRESVQDYGKLLAYRDVRVSYTRAIEMTRDSVIYLHDSGNIASMENLKQSTNISDAIATWRAKEEWYYETLNRYISLNSNWLTRQYIARMPVKLLASGR